MNFRVIDVLRGIADYINGKKGNINFLSLVAVYLLDNHLCAKNAAHFFLPCINRYNQLLFFVYYCSSVSHDGS